MTKRMPLRKCIACNQMKEKNELVRIVKCGAVAAIDLSGKADGRGCYVCKNADCMALAKKHRKVSRAFKMQVSDDIYSELEATVTNE